MTPEKPQVASRPPSTFYRGVGSFYIEMFEDTYLALWRDREPLAETAFLTVCSHAKPYPKSAIHQDIQRALFEANIPVDYIHISNAGIIPTMEGMEEPFSAYDWDAREATPATIALHTKEVARRLDHWFQNFAPRYKRVVVYLRREGPHCQGLLSLETLYPYLLVPVENEPCFPWALCPDIDDCLRLEHNLTRLTSAALEYNP